MDLDSTLRARPELFRNRLVFVGADYAGSGDRASVPNRGTIAGVVLHALIAETILCGLPGAKRSARRPTTVAAGVVCVLLCAALLLARTYAVALLAVLLVIVVLRRRWRCSWFHQAKVMIPIVGSAPGVGQRSRPWRGGSVVTGRRFRKS